MTDRDPDESPLVAIIGRWRSLVLRECDYG
jgi:hypothetical protein